MAACQRGADKPNVGNNDATADTHRLHVGRCFGVHLACKPVAHAVSMCRGQHGRAIGEAFPPIVAAQKADLVGIIVKTRAQLPGRVVIALAAKGLTPEHVAYDPIHFPLATSHTPLPDLERSWLKVAAPP